MILASLAALAGLAAGFLMYKDGPLPEGHRPGLAVLRDKYYVDEGYDRLVVQPYRALCRFASAVDARIVDGVVNGVAFTTDLGSSMLRLIQTGYVRNYALAFFAGTIVIVWYVLR
jgi:NADH-quinone oxidoreductase subunit L